MRRLPSTVVGCACALWLVAVGGCSVTPPRAWEKDLLARPDMSMTDSDALGQRLLLQIYGSKENASGGKGVGAGGCGCN
jgi:hypothetical protein